MNNTFDVNKLEQVLRVNWNGKSRRMIVWDHGKNNYKTAYVVGRTEHKWLTLTDENSISDAPIVCAWDCAAEIPKMTRQDLHVQIANQIDALQNDNTISMDTFCKNITALYKTYLNYPENLINEPWADYRTNVDDYDNEVE